MFQNSDFSFIHKYFIAEKQESLLFLIVGLVAVAIALFFLFFTKTNPTFYKGAAIPLIAIGIIQIVVGYTVYSRSDKQRMDVAYKVGVNPTEYINTQELPRMQKVNKSFVVYRYVEIALFIAGIFLVFYFKSNPEKLFLYGLGITLAIQSAIMLGADFFAEKRALVYTEAISSLMKK